VTAAVETTMDRDIESLDQGCQYRDSRTVDLWMAGQDGQTSRPSILLL
jgi:hypothetical protein